MNDLSFHAHGKLLLSGEYFVLDGSLALALPVNKGQSLSVNTSDTVSGDGLFWTSLDEKGQSWFSAHFSLPQLQLLDTSDQVTGERLLSILLTLRQLNPSFLKDQAACEVTTRLEFPRLWGFGSSSTLIHLLGQWAKVNPFILLEKTMGGSGYDIACAGAEGPLFYRLRYGRPEIEYVDFAPGFADHLFFMYLGKKQNSREGIQQYRKVAHGLKDTSTQVSMISRQLAKCTSLAEFKTLIQQHEHLVSAALSLPRAKDLYFTDFPGEVKSLGAWGGDFVLLAGEMKFKEVERYCRKKGFEVVLKYEDIVKKSPTFR